MMIDERTKNICKKSYKYPNTPSFKEHQKFLMECNRAMWKQYIESIKSKD